MRLDQVAVLLPPSLLRYDLYSSSSHEGEGEASVTLTELHLQQDATIRFVVCVCSCEERPLLQPAGGD